MNPPAFPRRSQIKPRTEFLAVAALTLFFFVLALSRLGDVPYLYFDELSYVRSGESIVRLMLTLARFESPHPPLAKIFIGISVILFGQNPVGWRLFEAVFATLMIPLLYLFARRIFGPGLFAVLPPLLLTFDFMHFVLAKLASLDGIFVFFALLMQYVFYEYYQYARENDYAHSTKRMILAAIAFGLAFASKWPAAFSLLGFAVVFLYLSWRRHQQNRTQAKPARRTLHPIVIALLCLILAGVVYMLTWIPYLAAGWSPGFLLYRHAQMYELHTSLSRTFPYDSRWWSWPLMLTPIPFVFRSLPVQKILMMGNPSIWWATYPILALSLIQVIRRRDETLGYLLVAFLSSWLPFALLSRFQIIYYFYASLPLLILLIAYWLRFAWRRMLGRICVISYLAAVVYLFALFYPVLTAEPISRELAQSLRWLQGW